MTKVGLWAALSIGAMAMNVGIVVAQDKGKAPDQAPEKKTEPAKRVEKVIKAEVVGAKDAKGGDQPAMDPMMEAWIKAAQPSENHAAFKALAGNWKAATKMWEGPDTEPTQSQGSAERALIFEGRFLQSKHQGEMAGTPFEGLEVMGYDNIQKKFSSFWVDTMSTGMFTSDGKYDAATKTYSFTGEFTDPMGNKKKSRHTTKVDGNDQHTFTMFDTGPDGKEFKTLEIVYTRAK